MLVGGSLTSLKSGQNANVQIGGNVGKVDLGQNAQVGVGGNAKNINGATNASLKAGGTISGYANPNGGSITGNAGAGHNAASLTPLSELTAERIQLTEDLTALSQALVGLSIDNNPSSYSLVSGKLKLNAVGGAGGFALINLTLRSSRPTNSTTASPRALIR